VAAIDGGGPGQIPLLDDPAAWTVSRRQP